jgi:hypothetical protein
VLWLARGWCIRSSVPWKVEYARLRQREGVPHAKMELVEFSEDRSPRYWVQVADVRKNVGVRVTLKCVEDFPLRVSIFIFIWVIHIKQQIPNKQPRGTYSTIARHTTTTDQPRPDIDIDIDIARAPRALYLDTSSKSSQSPLARTFRITPFLIDLGATRTFRASVASVERTTLSLVSSARGTARATG